MNAKLVKHEDNKAVFEVEVSAERFADATTTAYKKMKGQFRIPGFRKGHAPRKIIEANYGPEVFYEQALDEVIPEAYEEAVKELKLEPIAQPKVDLDEIKAGEPVLLKFEVETQPHPELGDYKSIVLEKKDDSVSEEEVMAVLESEQKKNAILRPVEREAKEGDSVNIDFEGFKDDVAFEGGKGENYDLVLGSGNFIPGFEEQIVGHKAGEEFDIDVTFPENYGHDELADQEARFHIFLNEVREEILPELDDDFALDVSEFDSLEEYKANVRKQLEEEKAGRNLVQSQNEAIDKLIEISDVTAPQSMVEAKLQDEIHEMSHQVQNMGLTLDQYLQYTGSDMEELRKQILPSAELKVKGDLVLGSLIDAEGLEVTDEDLDAELRRLAEQFNSEDPEDFIKKVKDLGNDYYVRQDLLKKRAIEKLMSYVTYEEKKED